MLELNISKLKKSFSGTTIFEEITFDVKTNERIGLVGPNGCGKTTLLKIINKKETYDSGQVSYRKDLEVGYLDQIPVFNDEKQVIDILNDAFHDLATLGTKIDKLSHSFGDMNEKELEKALKTYTHMTEEFERKGGYLMETSINKVTSGLKIDEDMRTMPFHLLSGGEKTRVMLAYILLLKPSLLLLDEPSNHLDLESIEWLESYLKDYEGSVVVVSHDRYFLDNVCTKIIELSRSKAHVYHGNYSYYVVEKERRFYLDLKVYLNQERKIKRMEEQIKRYRIWGEMRDSDKMYRRAKELEKRLEKIERLDKPKKEADKMKIKYTSTARTGKRVLEASHITNQFDDLVLLKDAELEILYQDRLGILGKNGSGKSTLIKYLINDISKEEPIHKWGTKINMGYLPQEVVFEDNNISILDYFMSKHEVSQNQARNELAKALFIRDDVFKKIGHLSGGEKSKLLLCSLMFNNVNLMVLDEPTNHLDIDSKEILEDLLLNFEGTILFISHDRYFIQKIGTRIGEIEDKKLIYYEGDYDYYKAQKALKVVSKEKTVSAKKVKQKQPKKIDYKDEINHLEKRLETLEKEIKTFEFDYQKLDELYKEKEEIEKKYFEVLEKQEQMEG